MFLRSGKECGESLVRASRQRGGGVQWGGGVGVVAEGLPGQVQTAVDLVSTQEGGKVPEVPVRFQLRGVCVEIQVRRSL